MSSINCLSPSLLHMLEYEIKVSLPGAAHLKWDADWKFNSESWTYQLIQLMVLIAKGKVTRLTPVSFELEEEEFLENEVLTYYFEVENLSELITLLDLGKLVRSVHWPESWKIDPSWSFDFIDFRDGLFREKNALYYDLYFDGDEVPIGHLIRNANSWIVVKTIKKEFLCVREHVDLEEILVRYFPNFYRRDFRCQKSNGLYLHITFDTIFDKPSGSWVHN